jgi:hypothetical protein
MSGMFNSTRSTQRSVNAQAQARDIMERARAQWSAVASDTAQASYDANCFRVDLPTDSTVSISIASVNPTTNAVTAQTLQLKTAAQACTAGTSNQALKRITVTVSQSSRELARLTMDIPRP